MSARHLPMLCMKPAPQNACTSQCEPLAQTNERTLHTSAKSMVLNASAFADTGKIANQAHCTTPPAPCRGRMNEITAEQGICLSPRGINETPSSTRRLRLSSSPFAHSVPAAPTIASHFQDQAIQHDVCTLRHRFVTPDRTDASDIADAAKFCVSVDVNGSHALTIAPDHYSSRLLRSRKRRAEIANSDTNGADWNVATTVPLGYDETQDTTECLTPKRRRRSPAQGRSSSLESSSVKPWCWCRAPDDGHPMIECMGSSCKYRWFHFECVRIGNTKGLADIEWLCADCERAQSDTIAIIGEVLTTKVVDVLAGQSERHSVGEALGDIVDIQRYLHPIAKVSYAFENAGVHHPSTGNDSAVTPRNSK